MLSLLRGGPKILIIESTDTDILLKDLKQNMGFKESCFNYAYTNCGENDTMICLTHKMTETVKKVDITHVLVGKNQPDILICNMINKNKISLINKARLAPQIIVMRAEGNCDKILQAMNREYGGVIGDFEDILSENNRGSLITLSTSRLSDNVSLKNIYNKVLYVEEDYYSLIESLRTHVLRYINEGLEEQEWYELEIKIYDGHENYEQQYERIVRVIENLELGMILGESWGRDYPRFLMSVEVYRLRIFTIYSPKYIKKVLLALEYTEDGIRIVDYDVFYNRKKLSWMDILEDKSIGRDEMAIKYRKQILSALSEKELNILRKSENIILENEK